MIRLEHVTKEFHLKGSVKTVVRDLSLTIPRGRSLALLGRNGAGKSTLLAMMAGVLKPDSGRVIREGRVSFPLGFSGSFHRDMTGRQNILFVARIYGVDVAALTAYVQDFAELGAFMDEPVRVYSSGMRARLAFGVSMGIRFDTYIVDELTSVGDQNFKVKSKSVFENRLADADVIMVSHSMNQLRQYCDCGLVLEDGRLEVFDDLEEAIERHMGNMRVSGDDAALDDEDFDGEDSAGRRNGGSGRAAGPRAAQRLLRRARRKGAATAPRAGEER